MNPIWTCRATAALASSLLLCAAAAQPADLPQCVEAAQRAGVTSEVAKAMYLMEPNSPVYFAGFACGAKQAGIKFRYMPGGWFRSESFELSGKHRLRVTLARAEIGDSGELLLVPRSYEIDGRSYEVDRLSIKLLAHRLRSVLAND